MQIFTVSRESDGVLIAQNGVVVGAVSVHPLVPQDKVINAVVAALQRLEPEPLTVTPEVAQALVDEVSRYVGGQDKATISFGPDGILLKAKKGQQEWLVWSTDWGITWNCSKVGVWIGCTGTTIADAMSGPA